GMMFGPAGGKMTYRSALPLRQPERPRRRHLALVHRVHPGPVHLRDVGGIGQHRAVTPYTALDWAETTGRLSAGTPSPIAKITRISGTPRKKSTPPPLIHSPNRAEGAGQSLIVGRSQSVPAGLPKSAGLCRALLAEREAQVTLRRPGDRGRPVGAHHPPPPSAAHPLEPVAPPPRQPP